MYLITVARAVEEGIVEPVPLSRLADDLEVSAVSANQMARKLEGRGLMRYTPYRGVSLTSEGRRIAESILRRRRLWGVFLWEHLGLPADRADAVACDMEHITPDDVAERLAGFLGDPAFGPTGRPIPGGPSAASSPTRPLDQAAPGDPVTIVATDALPGPVASFLGHQGLVPGELVRLLGRGADGTLLVATAAGEVVLTAGVASAIQVGGPA